MLSFFFSGLRWLAHPWSLRVPTSTTPPSITCREAFSPFITLFLEENRCSSISLFLCGFFLYVRVRVLSSSIFLKHNTAQRVSHAQSSKASACVSERNNTTVARRKTWRGPTCRRAFVYSTKKAGSERTKKANLPALGLPTNVFFFYCMELLAFAGSSVCT